VSTPNKHPRHLPPVCVTKTEAALMLGMRLTSFEKYVLPSIKVIRRGTLVLVPVKELERWADQNAEYTLSIGRER
jgi:hypothetical protein